jgi:ribokinase
VKVINIGSLNVDHVYQVDHFSRPGESLIARSYARFAGGKGANQSIAIARAGASVSHTGMIGREGEWMLGPMADDGVGVGGIVVGDEAGGHAMIQVTPEGQNSIVVFGGTNQELSTNQVDQALDEAEEGDLVLLQNEINVTGYAIESAAKRGLPIFLNAAPMTEAVRDYPLDRVSVFFVNETEGFELTGQNDPDRIVARMLEQFPGAAIVLTLGPEGSLVADGKGAARIAAGDARPLDTTGAGDTYVGYFMAGLCEGMSREQAAALASAAADICVSRAGAASSIPYRRELTGAYASEGETR